MAPKLKPAKGIQDTCNPEMVHFDTKESSPSIPVKDYSNIKYPKKRSTNLSYKEAGMGLQGSRRKRRNRHEKTNSERSPQIPHSLKK